MSTKHSKAAEKFLQNKEQVAWHNETLWMVRAKRDKMSRELSEWEDLREKACQLKLYSNSHLEELLVDFEENATANGAIVHWAKDAEEYRNIIYDLLRSHGVKSFVKSKSMLSEECELDPFLISKGIDTVETDLGERILQLMHLPPSHVVLPAIHIKRQQVGELFEKEMGAEKGNYDPTYLTHVARKNLRDIFLNADAAMTGANFAVASTGDVVVCTNEGNADMGMSCPKLNISAFGLEKIVPDMEALGVFTRLLARSGTGQPSTTYTSHFRSPREGGEYHIIIVDNGRSDMLADRYRPHPSAELYPLRSVHEHLPGLSAERWLFVYLFHSRANWHQSGDGKRSAEVLRQSFGLFALPFLFQCLSGQGRLGRTDL